MESDTSKLKPPTIVQFAKACQMISLKLFRGDADSAQPEVLL